MQPRLDMNNNPVAATIVKYLVSASAAVEGTLPTLTQELVRIRSSQINGCSFCLDMHTKEATRSGETPGRIHLVAAWRDAKGFTEAERAALELAEQGARIATGRGVSDDAWANAAKHYNEDHHPAARRRRRLRSCGLEAAPR
jgi:AhpD family alkylhydroperoxidase